MIKITNDMLEQAKIEAKKRNPNIIHHFEVAHFTSLERDVIGFIGEFSACELLNIDWHKNIRPDYNTIDNQDIIYFGKKIDVKTETLPSGVLAKIITHTIKDDEVYGRRLINEGQIDLLPKYDVVIFGAIDREKKDYWYPIGWLGTEYILKNYRPTKYRPDGGEYPFAGLPIKTSDLIAIDQLENLK